MPFYPMKCSFSTCGLEFEYFTKPSLYDVSKRTDFRDVRCAYCGSFGTSERTYPSDSAPTNLTVKGTWGKHATPGLKGREFYTKQERDRQLKEVGSSTIPEGDCVGVNRNNSVTTYIATPDGVVKQPKPKKVAVKASYDPKVAKPSDLIREEGSSNGGIVDLAQIIKKTGVAKRRLAGGVMGAIRQGRLEKTDQDRVYRLV